jgi:hypothetical protein
VTPRILTLEGVRQLLDKPSINAAYKWLRVNGVTNRNTGRDWRVFESDVVAVLRRKEPAPVNYVEEGEKDFEERFGVTRWTSR